MNALIDPHATAIVYKANVPVHRSIGIDMTHRVTMPMEEFRSRFTDPLQKPIVDMSKHWISERTSVTFHDPLAALTIFNDKICTFTRGDIAVELASENFRVIPTGINPLMESMSGQILSILMNFSKSIFLCLNEKICLSNLLF